jgi:transcription-repair coupling factor (superfamily II helicase)
MGQRLRTYKRVSSARDDEALGSIREEIRDRYGRLPESVEQLFGYARLRLSAESIGILSIDKTSDGVAIKFSEKARVSTEKLLAFVAAREDRTFTPTGVLRLTLTDEEEDQVLELLRGVLEQIKE